MAKTSLTETMSSHEFTTRLCEIIIAYWAKRGHVVRAEPRFVKVRDRDDEDSMNRQSWYVHSDMVDGWPRTVVGA